MADHPNTHPKAQKRKKGHASARSGMHATSRKQGTASERTNPPATPRTTGTASLRTFGQPALSHVRRDNKVR